MALVLPSCGEPWYIQPSSDPVTGPHVRNR